MTVWVKYNVLNVVVQKTVIMIAVEIDQNQNDLAKLKSQFRQGGMSTPRTEHHVRHESKRHPYKVQ